MMELIIDFGEPRKIQSYNGQFVQYLSVVNNTDNPKRESSFFGEIRLGLGRMKKGTFPPGRYKVTFERIDNPQGTGPR